MTPGQRALVHMLAGLAVPTTLFDILPQPWNLVAGAAAAAAIAFFAFLDQSISRSQ